MAWRADEHVFLESKQHHSGDRLRPSQILFLEAALEEGVPLDSFMIVAYDAGPRAARKAAP
jgi:hypothetical protein